MKICIALDRAAVVKLPRITLQSSFVALFLISVSTFIATLFLKPNSGIADTDEGLYLLSANSARLTDSWMYPYGWHTRVLYNIVGQDISAFRLSGALLLFWATYFLFKEYFTFFLSQTGRLILSLNSLSFLCAVTSFLFYAQLGMRTPAYNWLNLFGIEIAMIGLMRMINFVTVRSTLRVRWIDSYLFSIGSVVAFPAKPITPILLILLAIFVFCLLEYFSVVIPFILKVSLAAIVVVGVLILTSVWPLQFYEVFLRTLNSPQLLVGQTFIGASYEFLKIPVHFFRNVSSLPVRYLVVLSAFFFILIIGYISKIRKFIFAAYFIIFVFSILVSGMSIPFLSNSTYVQEFRPFRFTLTFVAVYTTLFALDGNRGITSRISPRKHLNTIHFLILVSPFIFAFGSGHAPYWMAGFASFLWVPGIVVLVMADNSFKSMAILTSAFLIAILTFSYQNSIENPFRIPPVRELNKPININGSRILVSESFATKFEILQKNATQAGWKEGSPLVGLTDNWSSTWPFLLGARVPPSLMITIFGNPGSLEVAKYNIQLASSDFPLSNSWLLLTPQDKLDESRKKQINEVLNALSAKSGLSFPKDYQLIHLDTTLALYKPKEDN